MKRLHNITNEELVRALTNPNLLDLDSKDTGPVRMKDITRISDDELIRALTEPDLLDLR